MPDAAHQISDKRLHQINAIKRFFQSSQPLMLIVGEKGSGKTNLLSDIILQVRVSRMVIRLQGHPNLHPTQLADVLSTHWAIQHVDKNQRIESQFDEMLGKLAKHDQACILVIDDAHLLSLSVLAAISYLATQQDGKRIHLHIVLTGRPILSEKINSLQMKEVRQLTIGALSREEAFRKIKRLLDNAGLYLPHTAANAIFTKLYHRSEGMPETLENMVEKLIIQRNTADQPVMDPLDKSKAIVTATMKASTTFWKTHGIKTFSLLSLAVLGYLFWAWQHHHLKPHIWPEPMLHVSKPAFHPIYKKLGPKKSIAPKPMPSASYTLQIMSGMNTQAMKHFIQTYHLAGAHIMKTQYKGHDWYILTYGRYDKPSQAKSALATLLNPLKSRHPWVRSTKQLIPIGGP